MKRRLLFLVLGTFFCWGPLSGNTLVQEDLKVNWPVVSSFSDPGNQDPSGQNLTIYPNPASQFIRLKDNDLVREISLYNLVGRKVKTFRAVSGEQFFIGDLPEGMYLVQLVGNNDKVISTQRLRKR